MAEEGYWQKYEQASADRPELALSGAPTSSPAVVKAKERAAAEEVKAEGRGAEVKAEVRAEEEAAEVRAEEGAAEEEAAVPQLEATEVVPEAVTEVVQELEVVELVDGAQPWPQSSQPSAHQGQTSTLPYGSVFTAFLC